MEAYDQGSREKLTHPAKYIYFSFNQCAIRLCTVYDCYGK